ncbi:MAG: chorismate mutase [Chloroflexota bacterium]
MKCRGVRGAITVSRDDQDEILSATRELLSAILEANDIQIDDIASIYFTTTTDLTSTYPAFAARQLGWFDMALLCGHEMDVPDGMSNCIRVLIHWNTTKAASEIAHVYLREARSLRPDRTNIPPIRPRQTSQMEAAVKFLAMTL